MDRVARVLMLLIVAVGLIAVLSTVCFALQGGFGGGHGRYDRIVAANAMMWAPVFERVPGSGFERGDYLPIVLVPAALNASILMTLRWILRKSASSRG